MFETNILPVVEKYALSRLKDEGLVVNAIVLAWYYWSRCPDDYAAGHWARLAVRQVWSGRDLPGCGTGAKDALHRASQGSGMEEMQDRRNAGPLDTLIHREELERIRYAGGPKHQEVIALLMSGMPTGEVAEATGVTAGRVSQIRREALEDVE